MHSFFVTKHVSFVIQTPHEPMIVHVFPSSYKGLYNVITEDPFNGDHSYLSLDEINKQFEVQLTPEQFEVESEMKWDGVQGDGSKFEGHTS
jgi:hypothetical protein